MPQWISLTSQGKAHLGSIANGWNNFKNAISSGIQNLGTKAKALGSAFASSVKNQVGQGASNIANDVANGIDKLQSLFGSSSTGSASGVSSGVAVQNLPSVNTIPLQSAPITSAVSAISDPELRANAYNEMMSGSAHQREVRDLVAAGLNPVLSAKYGGAASSAYQVADVLGSGSGSGAGAAADTFLGLPLISRPTKPWQLAYNLVAANGDKILSLTSHAARQFADKYGAAQQIANTVMNNSARR